MIKFVSDVLIYTGLAILVGVVIVVSVCLFMMVVAKIGTGEFLSKNSPFSISLKKENNSVRRNPEDVRSN